MPISHKYKLFFVHIPKNAGTSLTEHLSLENIGHYKYDPSQVPTGYKTFCIIRHPLDRLVSCYEYAKMKESHWHSHENKAMYGPHPDYELLKNASMKECLQYLKEGKLKHQGWAPQWWWIANNGIINIDYVIKMENLDEGLNKMFKELNLPHLQKTPQVNASKRKHYQDYFDEEDLDIAKRIYSADLKTFEYE